MLHSATIYSSLFIYALLLNVEKPILNTVVLRIQIVFMQSWLTFLLSINETISHIYLL